MLIYGNCFLNGLSASSLIVPQPSDPITVELIYIRCHPEVYPLGYQKKDIRALGSTYLSRLLLTVPHTDLTLPTNQTECSTQSRCSLSHLFINPPSCHPLSKPCYPLGLLFDLLSSLQAEGVSPSCIFPNTFHGIRPSLSVCCIIPPIGFYFILREGDCAFSIFEFFVFPNIYLGFISSVFQKTFQNHTSKKKKK